MFFPSATCDGGGGKGFARQTIAIASLSMLWFPELSWTHLERQRGGFGAEKTGSLADAVARKSPLGLPCSRLPAPGNDVGS